MYSMNYKVWVIEYKAHFYFQNKLFSYLEVFFFVKRFVGWMSTLGVVGLVLNLCAYEFISQEIHAAEDPEFEIFYTQNILLNEVIRA